MKILLYIAELILLLLLLVCQIPMISAQDLSEISRLTATNTDGSPSASEFCFYGSSVAISGNYAIVGSSSEGSVGAAHIFYNNAGVWAQVKKITPPTGAIFDYFGISVSINGDYAVVGARGNDLDENEANTVDNAGSAYVFKKDQGGANNWGFLKKITASTRSSQAEFGNSVSMTDDYIVVGSALDRFDATESNALFSAGSAYIFKKDQGGPDGWGQIKKITAPVRAITDFFGWSVSISGNTIIAGAYNESEDAQETNTLNGSGSAYVFAKDQGGADNWGLIKKITSNSRAASDRFGTSVAVSGDIAVVAAPGEDEDASETNTIESAGSAYILYRNEGGADNWGQVKKITSSTRTTGDNFGASVAIDGEQVIVGAIGDDKDALNNNNVFDAGAAYIFKKDIGGANNWGVVQKLVASVRGSINNFGSPIAISGNYVLAGAPYEDQLQPSVLFNAGAVYLFGPTDPLPVILSTFKATRVENQALLSWTTSSEINHDYFEIQRSNDSRAWTTIGQVFSNSPNLTSRVYSFTDMEPGIGADQIEIYYRLKMVDYDGSYAYSRIEHVLFSSQDNLVFYPNPTAGNIYFDEKHVLVITLINSLGQIIAKDVDIFKGYIDAKKLTPGIYTVKVTRTDNSTVTQRMLITR